MAKKLPLCAMCGKPVARSEYVFVHLQTNPVRTCGWHTKCAQIELAFQNKNKTGYEWFEVYAPNKLSVKISRLVQKDEFVPEDGAYFIRLKFNYVVD